MTLAALLKHWRSDPATSKYVTTWEELSPQPAQLCPLPTDLPESLAAALCGTGIQQLYSHQLLTWKAIQEGKHVVLATGTASGKTLAYNLPVLASVSGSDSARALFLFPTKALAQDQLAKLKEFQTTIGGIEPAVYDGDTPQSQRPRIRRNARIVLSNPDMLHTGILPQHTNWADFLENLSYVVIDEMHTYRGVFGSHVANIIRRLKRLTKFYGSKPQFILTSATIGNPAELAGQLIEESVILLDKDGSGRGLRNFIIYNPPVTDISLGIRKSALLEFVRLGEELLAHHVQGLAFARSRRSVEMIVKYLNIKSETSESEDRGSVRGYRSGYLPLQRREIEQGLRDGTVRLVVATNALELGIDIGSLDVAFLVGYPGTIASTWQQAGRAGRSSDLAAAVLIATADPLDQFLARHPEYLLNKSPERALINPDHLLILIDHLRCAAFELPFAKGESFGGLTAEKLLQFLDILVQSGQLHHSKDKYYWMADSYPAAAISLRSASSENVVLRVTVNGQARTIGQVDIASAHWMIHPRAIYLHEGVQYWVEDLNLDDHIASITPTDVDYYTRPSQRSEIRLISITERQSVRGGLKGWGELEVTSQVVGFRKIRWFTQENLGEEPLDLPANNLQTTGYWLSLSDETVKALRDSGQWRNDPNAYGPQWKEIRQQVRARDNYCCQICGRPESGRQHAVHHKVPFRSFQGKQGKIMRAEANRLENLVTLCAECHHRLESSVRVRSGLAGLGHLLVHLAALFLMCDPRDLGVHTDPQALFADGHPVVVLYDQVPAGIGFSQRLFEIHSDLMKQAAALVAGCPCEEGCPSCVGPGGENGMGGKAETMAILDKLIDSRH